MAQQTATLNDEMNHDQRSAGSKVECPECGHSTPSQQKTDFSNNIRRAFPSGGCHRCGFEGVVYKRFGSEMDTVAEQVINWD